MIKKIIGVSCFSVVTSLSGGAAMVSETACGTPVPVSPGNVISDVVACAVDVVEDITIAPSAALLAQTVATCGIAYNDLYLDIAALLKNAQTASVADGGPSSGSDSAASSGPSSVTTRKGAVVVSMAYVVHLQAWQALMVDGGK